MRVPVFWIFALLTQNLDSYLNSGAFFCLVLVCPSSEADFWFTQDYIQTSPMFIKLELLGRNGTDENVSCQLAKERKKKQMPWCSLCFTRKKTNTDTLLIQFSYRFHLHLVTFKFYQQENWCEKYYYYYFFIIPIYNGFCDCAHM